MKLRWVALVAALAVGCQVISGVADLEVTPGAGDGVSDGGPGSTDGGGDALVGDALVGDAFVSSYASGTVYYLPAGKSVTLHLNGGPPLTVTGAAAGSAGNPFQFPQALAVGATYSVTADPSPDGACWVKNGTGTFNGNLADLDVRCVLTATATSATDVTLPAGNAGSPLTDFPSSPAMAVSFTTDRPGSDVLLSLYIPAVQSSLRSAKVFFALDVDGTVVQNGERTQSYYAGEGQSFAMLALTNMSAGSHTVKVRSRTELDTATVFGQSPITVGVDAGTAQSTYKTVLSAIVLDSMSTFDGVAKPVTTGSLSADAGVLDAGSSGWLTAASLPLDGLAGRWALALFESPMATAPHSNSAGLFTHLLLDTKLVATSELFSPDYNAYGPTLERTQSIAAFIDLPANMKPSLNVQWESVGVDTESAMLAAGSWLGAAYFKPSKTIATAPFSGGGSGSGEKCFGTASTDSPAAIGVTTTLSAPRAGKALVVFQAADIFASSGNNVVAEAAVVHSTDLVDGGKNETPVLYSYAHASGGYGQGSTMIAIVDVPKGNSTFDVRMRLRTANGQACVHHASGDPLATSTLGVMFIE
jgi:hypothetical protein